jgi:hypothetical protein
MKAGFLGVTESMEKAVSPNRFNVTRVLALDTGISSMVRGRAPGPLGAPLPPGPAADAVTGGAIGAAADGGGGGGGAGGATEGVSVTSAGGKATTGGGTSDPGGGTSTVGARPTGPDDGGGAALELEGTLVLEDGCAAAREDQPKRQGQQPSNHTNPRI